MGCLGNLLWFILGGALSGLSWCLAGCLWCLTIIGIPVECSALSLRDLASFPCVTIIGIPFGLQHFKLAKLALMPFGAEVY